jgi:hypothetical protein
MTDRTWMLQGVLLAVIVGAIYAEIAFGTQAILEGWLLAFVILAGLSIGSLGLLMIGHLLGEYWLASPVRQGLEAAARTMPLLLVLAVPIAMGLEQVYPWVLNLDPSIPTPRRAYFEPSFFLVRNAAYFTIWIALAFWIARPGRHRHRCAIGLALLTPTVTLAGIDWVMSRSPEWWSSLFGLVFGISQMLPALAGAVLLAFIRSHDLNREQLRSLERALITLTLLILWLWFVQFLIVWMTNIPLEVSWYMNRYENWGWTIPAFIAAALICGVLALLPHIVGGILLRMGTLLLLVQHGTHMMWLLDAKLDWTSGAVAIGLITVWLLWMASTLPDKTDMAAQGARV